MASAPDLVLCEVGPRDGLQNEPERVPTPAKLALLARLAGSGLRHLEIASFASPRWIPALADAEIVAKDAPRRPGVRDSALVPNLQGYERFRPVAERAKQDGVGLRAYVSTVCGCPYEGDVPLERLALHLHDTYGRALANVWAGYEVGIRIFDASLGGVVTGFRTTTGTGRAAPCVPWTLVPSGRVRLSTVTVRSKSSEPRSLRAPALGGGGRWRPLVAAGGTPGGDPPDRLLPS